MSANCHSVRTRLGEAGAEAPREDPAALRHLESCGACFARLEAVAELDRALAALQHHDAPETTVERLLAQVAREPRPGSEPPAEPKHGASFFSLQHPRLPRLAALLAGCGVAAALFFLVVSPSLMRARVSSRSPVADYRAPSGETRENAARQNVPHGAPPTTLPPSSRDGRASGARTPEAKGQADERERQLRALGYVEPGEMAGSERERAQAGSDVALFDEEVADQVSPRASVDKLRVAPSKIEEAVPAGVEGGVPGGLSGSAAEPLPEARFESDAVESSEAPVPEQKKKDAGLRLAQETANAGDPKRARGDFDDQSVLRLRGDDAPEPLLRVEPEFPPEAVAARLQLRVEVSLRVEGDGRVSRAWARGATLLGSWDAGSQPLIEAVLEAVRRWRYAPFLVEGQPAPGIVELALEYQLGGPVSSASPPAPTGEAARFVAERERRDGVGCRSAGPAALRVRSSAEASRPARCLPVQPARGYWANTWVPGDPLLRLLQMRLAAAPWPASAGDPRPPHTASQPPRRPFDPPQGAALGLFVQADRAALEGEQRLLVEVGLQATRHAGGRRPALELALVLDLREAVEVADAARLRAVVLGFARSRQGGDRFRLVVAGRSALAEVGPDAFHYGGLALGLDALLAEATAGPGDPGALPEALARAIRLTAEPAPGSAAAVVLVTAGALQPLGALAALAHRGAVTAAVTTSVVGVGTRVVPDELDQVALAGQGYRRLLERREEADALAERQLASAGRAVARALRLRIRLAPGVRLVEVVGSERLDARQAERVREAERSLDQRLARDLGLEADRGEDEDGIQIVIPSFEAGASHSILLDVVASGPGPIAEVTLRYKDLAFLRNGTASASLQLSEGRRAPGPLETSVVSLLLARRLEADLSAAGDAVARGDVASAAARLAAAVELRRGLPSLWPAFAGDPELAADVAMLQQYASALAASGAPAMRRRLSDSLRYAALLKRLPRPAPLVAEVP